MPDFRAWTLCGALFGVIAAGCSQPAPHTLRAAAADARAAAFQREWLPRMIADAREKFNPDSIARDFSRLVLDPSRLVLLEPTAVRVYFVAAQGGYLSALGYWLEGPEADDTDVHVIFPNAMSPKRLFEYADALAQTPGVSNFEFFAPRRADAPVLPGDFIDLGMLAKGTKIGFFLDSDAVHGAKGRFTTIQELNPDALQHVVTIAYQDSPYLMLAFEDLMGGGDRTFNDVVFTVELSKSGIAALGDAGRQEEVDALLRAIEWRKELRVYALWALTGALAVGGPFLLWMLRRYLRRRRIRQVLARAQERLDGGDPRGALQLIREGQRCEPSGALREHFADFEVQACKELDDAAHLEDLFARHPAAVLKDEAASLLAARAQLETDRSESFHAVRGAWQEREAAPWAWLTLESDLLVLQEKPRDAESLLRQKQFAGAHDAPRLARLAERFLLSAPAEAQPCLARALQLAPDHPEVHQSRARMLECLGRLEEAGEAWRTAAQRAGKDPFHRDHYAEFLVRRGDYAGALDCWRESLPPPTADTLWLKAFFWQRVTRAANIAWKELERPAGPLNALLEPLLAIPEDRFWQAGTLDALIPLHPECFVRRECLWLRALQAIRDRREDHVLALLSTSRSDHRRYFDTLETALRQVLTYRRMQFLHPNQVIVSPDTPQAWAVPLFQHLDAWAKGRLSETPAGLDALLMSPRAFSELFRAVGWDRAADLLPA